MKSLIVSLVTVLISLNIYSNSAQAADRDLCICQTGSEPESQIGVFKVGCQTWNMSQSCEEKITISINDSIENVLANRPNVKSVKIGYVGHWASSKETVKFLDEQILPAIKKHNVYFDIHNSACLSTSNPYEIKNYFQTIGASAANIHFYGYQVISSGGWDPLLPGKNNLWASINGKSLDVTFPSCKEFENFQCLESVQDGQKGICFDESVKKFTFLRCQQTSRRVSKKSMSGKGGSSYVTRVQNEWIKVTPKFKVVDQEPYVLKVITFGLKDSSEFDKIISIPNDESLDARIEMAKDALTIKISKLIPGKKFEVIIKNESSKEILDDKLVEDDNNLICNSLFVKSSKEAKLFITKIEEDVRNILIAKAGRRDD